MYQIRSTNDKGQIFYSMTFDSAWAANMIAIGYARQYPELVKVQVVNRSTGCVEKTYTR